MGFVGLHKATGVARNLAMAVIRRDTKGLNSRSEAQCGEGVLGMRAPLGGLGERCKLLQWSWGGTPTAIAFWTQETRLHV